MDVFAKDKRSAIMRRVKSQDTRPEMIIRKMLHGLGYRYRLHRKDLPGKPDLVFSSRKKVIFIHGCYWHGHDCKRGARIPSTNKDYWLAKIARNKERDQNNLKVLEQEGWSIFIVWECTVKKANLPNVQQELTEFLENAV